MIFSEKLVIAGAGLFKDIPDDKKHLKEIILAQWCLESGWGKSKLAINHNNFGGMKFRKEIAGDYYKPVVYQDWEGEEELYFSLPRPLDYQDLYFKFLSRSLYKFVDYTSEESFIVTMVAAGYCTSMIDDSGKKLTQGILLQLAYYERLKKIKESSSFAELIERVNFLIGGEK